jgi:hypothetical protein
MVDRIAASRVIGAVAGGLLFILLNAGASFAENPLVLRAVNRSSKPVDFYVDRQLKCKIPVGYECRIQKIPRGVHTVHMVRPDKESYDDTFMLPDMEGGKEYDTAGYLIKDDKVSYLLVAPH